MYQLSNQTRIQMRLKAAGMNIYSCYNNMMPPPPPPPPPRKVKSFLEILIIKSLFQFFTLYRFKSSVLQIRRGFIVALFGWLLVGSAGESDAQSTPTITIASTAGLFQEGGTDPSFTVSASSAPGANLTINLNVREASGSDFIESSQEGTQTVTINSGEASATYTVLLNDDEVDEIGGSLTVNVISGTGYTVGSGRSGLADVSIVDDDPTTLILAGTAEDIDEGTDKIITITLSRGLVVGEQLIVPLTFSGSTAMRGTDYTLRGISASGVTYTNLNSGNATVTFGRGGSGSVATATLTLSATADDADELGGETVNIDMGALVDNGSPKIALTGAATSTDNLATFRIKNTPSVTIAAGTSPITEGTAASFTVTAVPAPAANLPVSLTVAETAGSNFVTSANEGSNKTVTIPTSGSMTYTVATVGESNDEPSGSVMVALTNGSGYTVGSTNSATVTVNDDDPTVVSLARTGSTGSIEEGKNVEFTVTLGRVLIAGEIIDVPLIVSGTNITTADWSLARKTGNSLNTGATLVNETTATPVVRFSGAGAQTATLTLTTTVDNMAETGGSETLTLALGPDNSSANGFDLNTRMTNVGGGADPNSDATKNTFSVTINDVDNEAPMPRKQSLEAIDEQCELSKTQLDGMAPSATDNHPGTVTVTNNIGRFPIMSDTTITWTYTDAAGNTATQTQQVTIMDTTDPVPMEADLPVLEGCSQVTSLTAPTATDNCDGAIMGTTNVTPPITASTTITWTYTDAAGNAVTQMQEVVVNSDVLIPDVPSLPTLTDQCRIAALSSSTAKNCSGNTITATTTTNLPITTNSTITWTYSDAGNMTTQTQEVMIMDTMNPVPDNTLSALTAAGSLAQAEVTVPTATDNCDGQIMAAPDVTFPITSDATITWTYTDAAGNTTTQTQQVTITEAPLNAAEDAVEAIIFPNPSGRYLEVRSATEGTLQILSLNGKSLLEGSTNTRVDIASLQSGLYLVQLPDGRLLKFVRE